jgi:hypothetical protein
MAGFGVVDNLSGMVKAVTVRLQTLDRHSLGVSCAPREYNEGTTDREQAHEAAPFERNKEFYANKAFRR